MDNQVSCFECGGAVEELRATCGAQNCHGCAEAWRVHNNDNNKSRRLWLPASPSQRRRENQSRGRP